jgi:transcriptional regulator with XRE-family HTH domain
MGLGERIAEAIAGSGKTKAQIARECDVTGGAVSQWLSGSVKSLKAETAIALEQATGYRAYWLLHGKGPRTTAEPTNVWPFTKVPLDRFIHLDERDQGYVERRLIQAIEECELFLNQQALPQLEEASALGQIGDSARRSPATDREKVKHVTPAHQLESQSEPNVGPALQKAFDVQGVGKREPGKSGGVQKPRSRRSA